VLLVALTVDAALDAAGLAVAVGDGSGTAGVLVWKYEQPETARAASRMGERFI